jgi:hypothetical protein
LFLKKGKDIRVLQQQKYVDKVHDNPSVLQRQLLVIVQSVVILEQDRSEAKNSKKRGYPVK